MPALVAQYHNLSALDGASAGTGAPNGWSRTDYKDADGNVRLQANIHAGQVHDLTGSGLTGHVVSLLGLDKPTGACGIEGDAPVDTGSTSGEASTSVEVSVGESTGGAVDSEDTTTTSTTTSTTSNPTTPSTSTSDTTSAASTGGATTTRTGATPPAPTATPSATVTDTAVPPTTGTTAGLLRRQRRLRLRRGGPSRTQWLS